MKKQSLQEIDNIVSLMERIENIGKTSKIVEQKERLMALSSLKPLDESGINRILSHGENGFMSRIRNKGFVFTDKEKLETFQTTHNDRKISPMKQPKPYK